ncbi:MAG: copper resistance protein B, partial [Thiohalocapsa sp.]
MKAIRTVLCAAAALGGMTTAAAAQVPTAPAQPSSPEAANLGQPVADRAILVHGLLDQFEGRTDGGAPDLRWSGEGWVGTDYDKFWVKTEGFRRRDGSVDDGRHEFLYSRAVSTYFDLQGGLRSDIDSRRNRNRAIFGVHGLAPLFFELDAAVYAGDKGVAGRVEGSYDLLLTNRLILQPQVEVNLYSQSDAARLVGAGLSDIDT